MTLAEYPASLGHAARLPDYSTWYAIRRVAACQVSGALSSTPISIDTDAARTLKLRTEKIKKPPDIFLREQFDFYGYWFLRFFRLKMNY